jgi:hypothetical protein
MRVSATANFSPSPQFGFFQPKAFLSHNTALFGVQATGQIQFFAFSNRHTRKRFAKSLMNPASRVSVRPQAINVSVTFQIFGELQEVGPRITSSGGFLKGELRL